MGRARQAPDASGRRCRCRGAVSGVTGRPFPWAPCPSAGLTGACLLSSLEAACSPCERGPGQVAAPVSTDGLSEDKDFSRVWELTFLPGWEGVP